MLSADPESRVCRARRRRAPPGTFRGRYLDFFFRDPPLGQPNENLLNDAKDFFPALKAYLLADDADANAIANAADAFDKARARASRAPSPNTPRRARARR